MASLATTSSGWRSFSPMERHSALAALDSRTSRDWHCSSSSSGQKARSGSSQNSRSACSRARLTPRRWWHPSVRWMRPSRRSINAVEDMTRMGLDRAAEALLIVRTDMPGESAVEELALIAEVCGRHGASEIYTSTEPAEGEALLAARRAALPALETLGSVLIDDVGVPVPALPSLVRRIQATAARHDVLIAVVAHAGDGNIHPVIVYPTGDCDAEARARRAFGDIMGAAIELGGTITGEHGVGRLKAPWLADQVGRDVMTVTARIKDALDPRGILNPGVILETVDPASKASS